MAKAAKQRTKRNKGGKPRLVPGEQTFRFSINAPESLAKKVIRAAEKDGISYGEWFRRLAAKELGIDYGTEHF